MPLVLAFIYVASLAAVFAASAWRERSLSSDNLVMCLGLLVLVAGGLVKSDAFHLDGRGVLAGAAILNASILIGTRLNPIAAYRASLRDQASFRALDDSQAADTDLAAFRGEAKTSRIMGLWLVGLVLCAVSRPSWFGF